MTAPAELFEEVDAYEGFDGLELADERFPFVPGKKVFAPGGLSSATLHTPKGPARLNLPAPVPTLTQYRSLEQTVNSLTQRLNATNAQLLQVRRELASRPREPMGGGMGMIFSLLTQRKLRDELESHTHTGNNTPPTIAAGSGSRLDSILPLLLLQPNLLGGGGTTSNAAATGQQEAFSPLLLAMLFLD